MLHTLAPFFSVFFALVAFAAIPFGPPLLEGDRLVEFAERHRMGVKGHCLVWDVPPVSKACHLFLPSQSTSL